MSHEAVWISNKLVGTFHSKVGIVSQGLGHISTTLDPEWEGPLLFSLNNPTNKRIKLIIGETISGGVKYKSFVTLILYKLISTPTVKHDNDPGRMTILKHIKENLGDTKKEKKLKLIFNKIESLQINVVGISSAVDEEERDKKIQAFIHKYQGFDTQIAGEIEQVNELRKKAETKHIGLSIIVVTMLILGCASIIGWSIWLYNNNSVAFIPIVALINSVYIFIAGKIIEWLKKGR